MADEVTKWWEVQFAEPCEFESMKHRTDVQAIEFIQRLKALNDPAYVPVGIKLMRRTVSVEVDSYMPLVESAPPVLEASPMAGVSTEGVAESVYNRWLFSDAPRTGKAAFNWIAENMAKELTERASS